MRPIRKVTAEEENFRMEPVGTAPDGATAGLIRRDPVKPEPEGTIVLLPFRVTGYDPDCDGSLMARLENINFNGEATGWEVDGAGLGDGFVITQEQLLDEAELPVV